nr:hypothetical protein HK105_005644 [Polyrhizophydium stewartii]
MARHRKAMAGRSRQTLLSEIKRLGGDATDLDLLEDVLSGSEREDNDSDQLPRRAASTAGAPLDEASLLRDLKSFMSSQLKLDPAASQVLAVSDEEEYEDASDDEPPQLVASAESAGDDNDNEDGDDAGEEEGDGDDDDDVFAAMDEDDEEQLATTYGKGDVAQVQEMVAQMLKGKKPVDKLQTTQLIDPSVRWWTVPLVPLAAPPAQGLDRDAVAHKLQHAKKLWEEEAAKFERARQAAGTGADKDFLATILKSGTTTDKISALTLLIQEAPLHNFAYLRDHMINGMARKKSRREAMLAIDSIKDLLINSILPDRKLKYFIDQPCLSRDATREHQIVWYFEDALKKAYFEFIQLLEASDVELARDPLPHVKNKMLSCIFDLLAAKPEEEGNLLALLVNKLGDLDKKIASKAVHLLQQLLQRHPAMKVIVIKEVERLLFRTNVAQRAQYYAVTFLNQIVLAHGDVEKQAANLLVEVYFKLFEALVNKIGQNNHDQGPRSEAAAPGSSSASGDQKTKKSSKRGNHGNHGKHGKHGKHAKAGKRDRTSPGGATSAPGSIAALDRVDGVDAKMMAALLTGVNRAFPFASLDGDVFESHLDMLFKIAHIATFNTCIQALTLIFQVQTSRQLVSDRFYRALYATLFDPRLYGASKQALFLNLLFKSLRADDSMSRVRSFIKRIVQTCGQAQVPLICGSLYLIGELARQKPGLWAFITQPEEHDDEERFVDAPEGHSPALAATAALSDAATTKTDVVSVRNGVPKYDGRKRDPLFAHADQVCLWELCAFVAHFHPTVSLYARTLLSGSPIQVPAGAKNYDPLLNHTLARFLDRFVYKTPKKVKSLYHGSSLMQPRAVPVKSQDKLVAGGRHKRNVLYVDEEKNGALQELDDRPVNLVEWGNRGEGDVAPDEVFFYRFFKDRAAAARPSGDADSDGFDSDQELDDEEAWKAMAKSSAFPAGGDPDALGGGGDDDDDDLGSLPEYEDDEDEGDAEDMDGGDSDGGSDGDMDAWATSAFRASKLRAAAAKDSDDGVEQDSEDDVDGDQDDAGLDDPEDDQELADVLAGEEDDQEDESGDDEGDDAADGAESKGKTRKRQSARERMAAKARQMGYAGDYFDVAVGGDDFASADDFARLLELQGEEDVNAQGDEDRGSALSRKRKAGGSGRNSSDGSGGVGRHGKSKQRRTK